MKKILSILMAIAMLFTFAAIPAFAEDEAVDFTAASNIAYQKSVATIVAEGEPVAVTELTDGNEETAYTLEGAVTLDLGAYYQVADINIYFDSEDASVKVYAGNAVDEANLIGKVVSESATVDAGGVAVQYITFEATSATINEIAVGVKYLDDPTWNIALNKTAANVYGTYGQGNYCYTDGQNSGREKITNGDLSGQLSGNSGVNGVMAYYIDLGGYYMIDEVTIYTKNKATDSNVYIGQSRISIPYTTYKNFGDDPTQVKGTSPALSTPVNIVQKNGTVTSQYIGTVDFSAKKEVARFISIKYSAYSCYLTEVSVKGTPVEGTVIDFRKNNLALGKSESLVKGARWNDFWGGNAPTGNKKNTNGSLIDYYSGHAPFVIRYDLGDIYDITKVDLYCASANSTDFNIYLDTTATYDLGSESADRRKTDGSLQDNLVTVNGVDTYRATMEYDSVPARYVYVDYYGNYDFHISEIVVNGTKTVKFGEAGNFYSYNVDEETGAKTVTSVLRLFNGTDAASTAGKVYFAAYNASDALIGYTVADAASLEAGASVEIAPAAFAVTEEPAYVKAFYWIDGTFVPVLLPTNVK